MASEACGWVGESDMIDGSDQSCFSFFNFMHQHLLKLDMQTEYDVIPCDRCQLGFAGS